ncbi:unnamed protein product [Caenorhabditis angaria]|uniref:Major sperm protein n=1 Tax=Caenorhabditis angaria TaxID=860376 RepID=A0A9P1IFE6_9PELO|nr:unnamed protein product [Caenorhabditis angaria]CAI5444443.1 unnamed protein product [Caenorhabditis angaria]
MASKNVNNNGLVDAGISEMLNKPNEPAFKLGITINKVVFKCKNDKKPVNVPLVLFNNTNDIISYKVRCTSADIFRVQPPLGIIKPNSNVDITIWYQNQVKPDAIQQKHYFAFYHTKGDGRTVKEIWANAKIEGVRRIPATFEAIP